MIIITKKIQCTQYISETQLNVNTSNIVIHNPKRELWTSRECAGQISKWLFSFQTCQRPLVFFYVTKVIPFCEFYVQV